MVFYWCNHVRQCSNKGVLNLSFSLSFSLSLFLFPSQSLSLSCSLSLSLSHSFALCPLTSSLVFWPIDLIHHSSKRHALSQRSVAISTLPLSSWQEAREPTYPPFPTSSP